MPAVSISHSIWFIIAIIVSAGVAGALVVSVQHIADGIEDRAIALEGLLKTSIKIINDPENVPYNTSTNTLIIYVKNTGGCILNNNTDGIFIMLNGISKIPSGTKVISGREWLPGKVLQINITIPDLSENKDYRIRVEVSGMKYSVSTADTMDFRIKYN